MIVIQQLILKIIGRPKYIELSWNPLFYYHPCEIYTMRMHDLGNCCRCRWNRMLDLLCVHLILRRTSIHLSTLNEVNLNLVYVERQGKDGQK